MTQHRVLLVSPVFHGYWSALAAALEHNGHSVMTHCFDHWDTGRGRARNALAHRGFVPRHRIALETTNRAISALRAASPSAVLVVKGDALGPEWWEALKQSGVPTVLWLYDELERMNYTYEQLRTVGSVMSYSKNDVDRLRGEQIDASLLPDGYDSLTRFVARPSAAVNIVGARYPERDSAARMLDAHGVRVEAFGREWSQHPWDRLRTGRLRADWLRSSQVSCHRDVRRSEYYGVMAGSLATLNIHGSGHDGLSMRTFEAPGVGGLQLIDRPSVSEYYEPGAETLVYTSNEELREAVDRARRDTDWARRIREAGQKRTLAEHTLIHRMRQVEARWG